MRTVPAPHAVLNGAPEALALVHCLIARRVEAIAAEIDQEQRTDIQGLVEFGARRMRLGGWTYDGAVSNMTSIATQFALTV